MDVSRILLDVLQNYECGVTASNTHDPSKSDAYSDGPVLDSNTGDHPYETSAFLSDF